MMPTTIDIVLPQDEDNQLGVSTLYHGGDDLIGSLEIDTALDGQFCVVITFEGHARTWLNVSNSIDITKSVRTAEHQFLKESMILRLNPEDRRFVNGRYSYHVPFEFVVPEQLISSHSDIPSEYLSLPPSVKTGKPFYGHGPYGTTEYMQPSITYFINAVLFDTSNRDCSYDVHHKSREVMVMPYTLQSPPTIPSHFPGEYKLSTTGSFKRRVWSHRSLGKLTISATEPQALNISTSDSRALTLLPITLSYSPTKRSHSKVPSSWDFTIKSYLRARTFYTIKRFSSNPTLASIKDEADTELHVKTTKPEGRVCSVLPRSEHQPVFAARKLGTGPHDPTSAWTETLMVPVSAPKNLAPTFLAPLVARRYALVVQIGLIGHSHEALEIEVPVQVICDPLARKRGSWRTMSSVDIGSDLSSRLSSRMSTLSVNDIIDPDMRRGSGFGAERDSRPPPYVRTR